MRPAEPSAYAQRTRDPYDDFVPSVDWSTAQVQPLSDGRFFIEVQLSERPPSGWANELLRIAGRHAQESKAPWANIRIDGLTVFLHGVPKDAEREARDCLEQLLPSADAAFERITVERDAEQAESARRQDENEKAAEAMTERLRAEDDEGSAS
jgi:hypothetical protein